MAKVETGAGVEAIDEIAANVDAVLLGRGDLLLDVGELELYAAERRVIDATLRTRTPIIVGTDLLNSLSRSWLPNRSELAHLSWLLELGIHGVLLSRETTIGTRPMRTIALVDELRARYGSRTTRRVFSGDA
jgi:pyruvate kinase